MSKMRKRGGQPKPANQRKNSSVTIRLLDDLRHSLEVASQKSGRSVSEEIAWRCTLTFLMDTKLQDLTDIKTDTLRMAIKIARTVNENAKRAGQPGYFTPRLDEQTFERFKQYLWRAADKYVRGEMKKQSEPAG